MEYVNEKTLIGEIVNTYPESIEVLLGVGMHCLGCPACLTFYALVHII